MKFTISKVTLVGPFVRQKGGIIFRVIDVENEALNLAGEDIFRIEGIVSQPSKMAFVMRKERRPLVALEECIPLLSPVEDSSFLVFHLFLIHPLGSDRNPLDQYENRGNQRDKNDFPFLHPEPPELPVS
jgi:hypothetical protein